jgi:alcohol dehydrogenase class IV
MRTTWTFQAAGQLLFGRGAADQLGDCAGRLGARRVLVITDRSLVEAGVVEPIRESLAKADIAVELFDGGAPEPPITCVTEAVAAANKFRPDVLLGLGGGSNMDIAKSTAVVLSHGGAITDYAGDQVVPGPVFPLILVPTTAGTGSEVTAAAVLADPERGSKFGILSNHLRPQMAVVDPLLTVSCPPHVTAASGIDALTHAVEAFTAIDNEVFPLPAGERTVYQGRHPLADGLAEQAIALVGRHLRKAVSDGNNLEAREGMALAATLAGMAFSNTGVALVHALEYALNKVVHTPHGLGCGLLLPFVMRFNAPARLSQMRRIAELLGEDVSAQDDESAAQSAAAAVDKLKADIGIPLRMSDVNVCAEHLPEMAETAASVKRILRVNPRRVTLEDLQSVLDSAM